MTEKVNLVKNHSFESGWSVIESTSEQPDNWKIHTYGKDEILRYPQKMQNGALVPALSSGNAGEYVLKGILPDEHGALFQNLPQDEMINQTRALVIDGVRTFKIFSGGVPDWFAADLYQDLDLIPGAKVAAIVPVCAETFDIPTTDKLEPDHFRVQVSFAELPTSLPYIVHPGQLDERRYQEMIHIFDHVLPDGQLCQRPWNFFKINTIVPADGKLRLNLYFQQNWPRHQHGVDFFIDNVQVFYTDDVITPPADDIIQKELAKALRDLATANGKLESAKVALDSFIVQMNNLRRSL